MSWVHILLGVLVAGLWAGNFVAAKIGLTYFPPMFLNVLRFAIVAACLVPFVPLPRDNWRSILLISTCLALHFVLLFYGLAMGLDISTAVITGQLSVPFACLLGAMMLNDSIGLWRSFGLMVSFLGLVLVSGTPNVTGNFPAFLTVLAAALAWAFSNVVMKRMREVHIMQLLGWMSVFALPQMILGSLLLDGGFMDHVRAISPVTVLPVCYTAFCSTIAAYGIWYWLLKRHPVSMVAPFSLMVPVFGVVLGMLVFGEVLTWPHWVGGLMILAGVGVIVIRRPRIAIEGEPS